MGRTMKSAPKPVRGVARVKAKRKTKKETTAGTQAIANEILTHLLAILSLAKASAQVMGAPGTGLTCDDCKDTPCKDVPVGKTRILVCSGKTLTPLVGTAAGQYLSWDNTNNTWVLTNP